MSMSTLLSVKTSVNNPQSRSHLQPRRKPIPKEEYKNTSRKHNKYLHPSSIIINIIIIIIPNNNNKKNNKTKKRKKPCPRPNSKAKPASSPAPPPESAEQPPSKWPRWEPPSPSPTSTYPEFSKHNLSAPTPLRISLPSWT